MRSQSINSVELPEIMFVENSNWLWLPGMMNDEYRLPAAGSCGRWKIIRLLRCTRNDAAQYVGPGLFFGGTPTDAETKTVYNDVFVLIVL
jgi:hypothetical protein